jgi:MYXO-CTERM domain-containing protein
MVHVGLVLLANVGVQPFAGTTVQDAANAGGCSTTVVEGLSKQIVGETNCLIPKAYGAVPTMPNLAESSATFAFLQTPARDAFVKTLSDNPSMTMNVESMLRTVASQYLLYAWYQAGSCGIQLAATPGTSNHEQGLAFDTSDYAAWKSALEANGFQWYGSADVVHFDYVGAGSVNLDGKDVLAFQKLWNLNNPGDAIGEDGQYGPLTETRLQKSPADGFPIGPPCDTTTADGGAPPADGGTTAHPDAGGSHDAGHHTDAAPAGGDGAVTSNDAATIPFDSTGAPAAEGGQEGLTGGATGDATSAAGGCACRAAPADASWPGPGAIVAAGLAVLLGTRRPARPARSGR